MLANRFAMPQFLGKVKDFIGVISVANKRLQEDAKDNSEKFDIEMLTGNESEVVEMDLMLGIADLHTPAAVAAAESAIGNGHPLISLAASSSESESESEDTSDESESDDEASDDTESDGVEDGNDHNKTCKSSNKDSTEDFSDLFQSPFMAMEKNGDTKKTNPPEPKEKTSQGSINVIQEKDEIV
ncbi:hypothetical protein OIU76_023150 [Salix suchowensis]|nr:hypothetical protein OIU76_023150 [Salix suchowensis]